MMKKTTFFAFVVAALGQAPLAAQSVHLDTVGPDVAVHDALPQDYPFPFPFDTLGPGEHKTDVDHDGIIDLALWVGELQAYLMRGGDLGVLRKKSDLVQTHLGPANNRTRLTGGVPLNLGGHLAGAANGLVGRPPFSFLDNRGYLMVWDLDDGKLLKSLPLPDAPGPGLPKPIFSSTLSSVGDLDHDGYDELLLSYIIGDLQPYLGIAVVDGASLEYKYVKYFPAAGASSLALHSSWPDPCQDVDGDGVKDLFLVSKDNLTFSPSWYLRCISGVDGSEIWFEQFPAVGLGNATIADDMNGDGIRDLFFFNDAYSVLQNPGYFRALSGQDGSLIWERTVSEFDPFYSEALGTNGVVLGRYPNVTGDLNSDGIQDIVLPVLENGKPELWGTYLWYLSGLDGELLSRDGTNWDAKPWVDGAASGVTFLGDIDNDGWAEYSGGLQGLDEQGFQELKGFAFIGRKTLTTQEVAHEGDTIRLKLHIPTGANKTFRIILTTVFELEGHGLTIGTWKTHFMPSLTRLGSIMNPALQGTLNQFGKGGLDVRIPRNARLAGKDLYAIAIVEDGTRPSGVLTKSTVSVIEILP